MDSSGKELIYKEICEKYIESHTKKYEPKIETILNDLALQETRSLILVGCAYLEELCKNCLFETMTTEGKIEYLKRHSKDLTLSLASTLLFAQNYISIEIFNILNYIRDIRNKYAHIPIIEQKDNDSIFDKTQKLRQLLNNRWLTLNFERIKKINGEDNQLYFIVFENLFYGLMSLEMFLIPIQKLARLQFIDNQPSLKVTIHIDEINQHSLLYFENKFNK